MYREIPRERWAIELAAFTTRNAQRPTVIEVDIPDIGVQEQERDYPMRGITYDRRDERVSIMLGELKGADPHLTHSIPAVRSVAIGKAPEGRSEVVRIAHDEGQTLVWVKEIQAS